MLSSQQHSNQARQRRNVSGASIPASPTLSDIEEYTDTQMERDLVDILNNRHSEDSDPDEDVTERPTTHM